MSSKTRSFIRALAVILVALGVLLELDLIAIRGITEYSFWLVVIAFGLILFTSR